MFDGQDSHVVDGRGGRFRARLPRELVIGATVLATIMVAMGLALWAIAGQTDDQSGQPNADTSVQLTSQLMRSLADDLGPNATAADLEAAVQNWLADQGDRRSVVLAVGPLATK